MITNDAVQEYRAIIKNADAIIIGSGAGLSTAARLNYGGERFAKHFPNFI